jgi:hypothetical protein
MKRIGVWVTTVTRSVVFQRLASLSLVLLYALCASTADASMLVSETSLVTGTESSTYSFDAPGPGTLTVQLSNLDWPQSLSTLSFAATTANQVMGQWSTATSQTQSYQIGTSGLYFADIMATAGGPLDLGLYSLSIDFTPAGSPVPLPPSGWLLIAGVLTMIALLVRSQHSPAERTGRSSASSQPNPAP